MSNESTLGVIRLHADDNVIVLTKAFTAGSRPVGHGLALERLVPSGHKIATMDLAEKPDNMRALFDAVLKYVPEPVGNPEEPLQLQISALDYSTYVGRIGVGRVRRGKVKAAQDVMLMANGTQKKCRVNLVQGFQGLNKVALDVAEAGEIVLITGIEEPPGMTALS